MRTSIPEKLLKIAEEIDIRCNVPLERLSVLKKWFERPGRLPAFALWVAGRASGRKGKAKGEAGELFQQARALLAGLGKVHPKLDHGAAQALHDRLLAFQNTYRTVPWGKERVIHNWNLYLVEEGLTLYLGGAGTPSEGYKLAADYCKHYDPHYGDGLNGPSRTKILEVMRYMFTVEALEEELSEGEG